MIKTFTNLQDLRRRIYVKAKAEKTWKFWGMYVHVCKIETLKEAYRQTKSNKGAAGIDGVTFADVEREGVDKFLKKIQEELIEGTYLPQRNRKKAIPKENGKFRVLGIPSIRDRVVQGALKLVLEPVFEADFYDGSFGYRPKRTAQQAVFRVSNAIVQEKTIVIDVDLSAYFDTVKHNILLNKVAMRINDNKIMKLLKLILKASGKKGVPQGGTISPLLSNIYLTEVDAMLERAKIFSFKQDGYFHIEYARWADDIVILIDGYKKWRWLKKAVLHRLKQELVKIGVVINEEKTKIVDLEKNDTFSFLGFDFRRKKSLNGKWSPLVTPTMTARTRVVRNIKDVFKRHVSQPVDRVIYLINPILRGWLNYFRIGNSSKCFNYLKDWVQKKLRRHLMRSRRKQGFGWDRWSNRWFYDKLNLYGDYRIRHLHK